MHHETALIALIALGFVSAFGFGFVADRLRLPPLVGYLLAGVVMGPFTPGFVADSTLAGQLAEMGVILLMFGVGLHFSAADLMAVRWVAIPGAVGQIVLATLLGAALAMLWGWSLGGSIVFGLSLSVASTVVLLRALEERNAVATPNGRIAVGWLIVEDLAMVLALVLLPAFAEIMGAHGLAAGDTSHAPAESGLGLGAQLALTLGKVVAFVALAMLIGPKIVPWILKQVARTGSRELFTLSVLALALGIAYGSAVVFGVSFALGAFFAGVVLSESQFSHRAAADSLPLQDAFAVLFFVSVGMLFDPSILIREPLKVLAVLALIVVGKSVVAFLIVLLMRFPASTALTVSASLAQIGEFSFILAGLGVASGLMPAEGRDLILAGALLSIMLNPLSFAAAAALIRRQAGKPGSPFGAVRMAALEQELEAVRRASEARHMERGLEAQQIVEKFPIFASLSPDEREELLMLFRPRSANPGDRVIRKGERPDAMYFISSGTVQVSVNGRTIELKPGDFFGEMGLLSGERRTADVTAVDYCKFLSMTAREFRQFINRHPNLRAQFDAMAAQRRRMNENLDSADVVAGAS
ncbi:cation:proton antiporter domain-containing protein [Rhodoligotrophos ferricapiens]|uniref:cation:proton antiporter domain-containing protein n=1 Tax=Rhodoligotrophos ferricapiens TaxID=3069264 RepID=UPI00315DA649